MGDSVRYTTVSGGGAGEGLKLVSKRKVKTTPEGEALLAEKFARIEKKRKEKEKQDAEILKFGSGSEKKRILVVTHFNVFMYAACFFIQTGTLPYLTKKLGADPVTFGTLSTVFSVCQLLGGPIYGRLGDVLGEKTALLLAFTSTFLTYLITGLSYSLPVLFFSRLFSVLMHVMQGSQMVATSLSSSQDRAGALARLGFSYGLGMVVGPSLGGQVTKHFGEQYSALLSAAGSLFSLALVWIFVPEIKKDKKNVNKDTSVFDLKKIVSLAVLPAVRGLLLVKTVCGLPISILQSMFSVIAMEQFGLEADQNGFLMSYIGMLSLLMQGFGVSLISSRLSDTNILNFSAFTLTLAYFALSMLRDLSDFLILLAPLVFSLALVNSVISSTLTKSVSDGDTGTMLGINMAVNSVIRALAPTVGGWMLASYGFASIGLLGAACNLLVLLLIQLVL